MSDDSFWNGVFKLYHVMNKLETVYGIFQNMDGMTVNFDVSDYINDKKLRIAFNDLPDLGGSKYYLQLLAKGLTNATYTGSSADYTVENMIHLAADGTNTFDSSVKVIEKHPDPSRGCELELTFQDNEVRFLQILIVPDVYTTNDFDAQEDAFDQSVIVSGNDP